MRLLEQPLVYSKHQPESAGWYWLRDAGVPNSERVVQVTCGIAGLMEIANPFHSFAQLAILPDSVLINKLCEYYLLEWAGPIPKALDKPLLDAELSPTARIAFHLLNYMVNMPLHQDTICSDLKAKLDGVFGTEVMADVERFIHRHK
jgi:hypothetical protein